MNRRVFLTNFFAATVVPQTLFASEHNEQRIANLVFEQLKNQGFTDIRIRRTWLGRIRFDAVSDEVRREIVINPKTGEVLRDIWREIGSDEHGRGLFDEDDRKSSRKPKRDDDDRDDDDDDRDDDEDRSGKNDDDDDDDDDDRSGKNDDDDDDKDDDDDDDKDDDDDDDDKDDDDDDDKDDD